MSTGPSARRRRKRGAGVLGWLIRIAAAVIVFAVGVAVGQALEDGAVEAGHERPNHPTLDADEPRDGDANRDRPSLGLRGKQRNKCSFA